nr:hypothetical protein [Nanoarchaeum sp.]
MDKHVVLESIKKLREISPKRKFNQTLDISVNVAKLDIKNPEQKIDVFVQLPHKLSKEPKVCALVDRELSTKAKTFDKCIVREEFVNYSKDKKELKKLSREYDYFVAQANLMAEVGSVFGRVLAPLGKMPNPKAGCIVPPTADLEPLAKRLKTTVRLITKEQLVIKAIAGTENMSDDDLAENILAVHGALLHKFPQGEKVNMKSFLIKFTMSPSVQITDKGPVCKEIKVEEKPKKKVAKK